VTATRMRTLDPGWPTEWQPEPGPPLTRRRCARPGSPVTFEVTGERRDHGYSTVAALVGGAASGPGRSLGTVDCYRTASSRPSWRTGCSGVVPLCAWRRPQAHLSERWSAGHGRATVLKTVHSVSQAAPRAPRVFRSSSHGGTPSTR